MSSNHTIESIYNAFIACDQKICTDTRKIEPESIFFALNGANFNGNLFVAKALSDGASFAVIDDENFAVRGKTFLVPDVLQALQQLAKHHRRQFSLPVLGITGSNAKTTHKELINSVLSRKYNTLATIGNLNNHIGVPLTLLRLKNTHEFAIIEMGANHQGEIDELCRIAEPDFGLITNIGKAHLEGFGGIEGVKKGKSEMYRFISSSGGKVFINGDDETLNQLAIGNDKITYGSKKLYDVIGKDCTINETVSFKFTSRYGEKDWAKLPMINTKITGSYNFINCLAAVCIGLHFKVPTEEIIRAIETYIPEMNRSQLVKTQKNTILLDAYNANPNSMKVAIENFSKYNAEKKLLLLGDMFELGEHSEEEHKAIVRLLQNLNLGESILVGENFQKAANDFFTTFRTTEECKEFLKKRDYKNYSILIKGSRGMKMEILQEIL
jgi:UDP-N-acetylmuramoyl-tripeptide--D-alanyl-D-alanine ligase